MVDQPVADDRAGAEIAARLAVVREQIDAAAQGREVTLVAVTKTFPPEIAHLALQAGVSDLGENYAQELVEKSDLLDVGPAERLPRWHFIGGLQSNKIKAMGGRVFLWQTVDRAKLVDALARRVPGARILIQVNTTGEAQKSGCDPEDAQHLVDRGRELGLDVQGLMTVGPTSGGDPRPGFDRLRRLAEDCQVHELSMGMSNDFELAIEAGSTMVRVGSAIFGSRDR